MNLYSWDNHSTLKKMTGGGKARIDVSFFLKERGFLSLKYHNSTNLIIKLLLLIFNIFSFPFNVKNNSIVFIQYPHNSGQRFILRLFKRVKGIQTIFLIHDFESIRLKDNNKIQIESYDLGFADKIIALNDEIQLYIREVLKIANKPIVNLELWDYHINENLINTVTIDLSRYSQKYPLNVLIAGNLNPHKAGYLSKLKKIKNVRFFLMGSNFQPDEVLGENVEYLGSFNSNTRVRHINGSLYGLVWDGNSIDTCSGEYGEYLKSNLPHKTSFYLSNSIPIIIWKQAAVFEYLNKNKLAYGVTSLRFLYECLNEKHSLETACFNIEKRKISDGYYLNEALDKLGIKDYV